MATSKDVELGNKEGDEAPGEEGIPQKVPLSERVETLTKKVKARDPVKKGRCSFGTIFWVLCFMVGCFFIGFGAAADPVDVWEIVSASFLVVISFYAVTYLGGDPCLMDAFREQLFYMKQENGRFKESNDHLEGKITTLKSVSDDLEDLRQKLGADIETTSKLLEDMHRYSSLQTIAAVVNQFYAADWDNSGHIIGDEAALFIPTLDSIWALVPSFDWNRLVDAVSKNGMTLHQLSVLLTYLVDEDEPGCQKELEKIIASEPVVKQPSSAAAGGEQVQPKANLEEVREETGMTPPMPKWLQKAVEADRKSKDSEALRPCLECGPIQIWSFLHFALILASIAGIVFTVASFIVMETTNIIVAVLGLVLSAGLMAASRLLEVLRALRVEVAKLGIENTRLEASTKDLGVKVSRLMKLKKGLQVLEAECAGDATMAKSLVQKNNVNTKMAATGVIMRLFKDSDENENRIIDDNEVGAFIEKLKLVFGSVQTFDEARTRQVASGLTAKNMKELVDIMMDDAPKVDNNNNNNDNAEVSAI